MRTESDGQSEERFVEAAQNGHLESFGVLYERYYSPIFALAYSVLADRNAAEDAAQETFAVACREIGSLRSRDKFAAWLAAICRNVSRQMRRVERKSIVADDLRPGGTQSSQTDHLDVVRSAVWKLPAAERELVVLRYYDGFSHEQISRVLDISPGAVSGRLLRARQKIAHYLRRNGFAGGHYETP